MDDFLRACQSAVLDNDAKRVASQLSLPHVSLLQRANPDNDAHRLTINHLFGILLHTGDMRPLAALADAFGFDLVSRERPAPVPLLDGLQRLVREFAELTTEVHAATDDGRVCTLDRKRIERELGHVREQLDVLTESVRSA